MTKKLGTNPKAAAARERKADAKSTAAAAAAKASADAAWEDDDAGRQRKQDRAAARDAKAQAAAARKAENRALAAADEAAAASSKKGAAKGPSKLTQAQIEARKARQQREMEKLGLGKKKSDVAPAAPLEENLNHLSLEEDSARTVDEALAVLSSDDGQDRHPERRRKAAYVAYEQVQLPLLKAENPSLRMSQLKDLCFKNFQKAPENPMNQV